MLIALAFSLFQSGNESAAKSTFERMSRIDPALATRYPLFGASSTPAGQGRAAREGKGRELFGGEWLQ